MRRRSIVRLQRKAVEGCNSAKAVWDLGLRVGFALREDYLFIYEMTLLQRSDDISEASRAVAPFPPRLSIPKYIDFVAISIH